ncbi:hypothetical protein IQ06DRAFT_292815 [Phaeosphaeriaceae sp. SRC1lsM3a]|nr:hypothetical protein IQ06DRAFT_292815 [Stagonospora sp. SRC1lsM3a]
MSSYSSPCPVCQSSEPSSSIRKGCSFCPPPESQKHRIEKPCNTGIDRAMVYLSATTMTHLRRADTTEAEARSLSSNTATTSLPPPQQEISTIELVVPKSDVSSQLPQKVRLTGAAND